MRMTTSISSKVKKKSWIKNGQSESIICSMVRKKRRKRKNGIKIKDIIIKASKKIKAVSKQSDCYGLNNGNFDKKIGGLALIAAELIISPIVLRTDRKSESLSSFATKELKLLKNQNFGPLSSANHLLQCF